MAPIENSSLPGSDIWLKGKSSPRQNLPKSSDPLDPCKILEPSRKKIQSLESQRVMAVLLETARRIEIVTVLPHVLKLLSRFSVVLGTDLVALLENHGKLEEEFKQTRKDLTDAKKQSTDTELDCAPTTEEDCTRNPQAESAKQEFVDPEDVHLAYVECSRIEILEREAALLEQRVKYSLRDILRYFKKNPKAIEVILGCKLQLAPAHRHLVEMMTALKGIMQERLLTTPREQRDQKRYISDVMAREKKTNMSRDKLELRYREALKDKEIEISKHDAKITHLENELELLEKMTYEQQKRTVSESYKQCSVDNKTSQTKRTSFSDDIISLKRKLRNDRVEHRETERSLRKRTFKMATEVYNWVQKYDADMGAKQDECDLVERLYDEDKKDLAELQRHFEILQNKFDAIMEERRLEAEMAAKKEEEHRQMTIAATMMQALWRGYQVRRTLRGKSKKGAKKNQKGK